jgi:hypothetical protein
MRPTPGQGSASESKVEQAQKAAQGYTGWTTHYSAHEMVNPVDYPSTVATHVRCPLFRLPYDALPAYITKRLSPPVTTK